MPLKILSNSKNPYLDLLKEYFSSLIYQRLRNKEVNSKYIEKLSSTMISKFSISCCEKLLCSIKMIDSLKNFEEIMHFAGESNIEISDVCNENTTLSELKRSLEIKLLSDQIAGADRIGLSVSLTHLLDDKWTFDQLNIIFSNLKASNMQEKKVKERHFFYVLEIMAQYEISPKPENVEKIQLALKEPPEKWQEKINRIAVENRFFEMSQVKSAAELVHELEQNNISNKNLANLLQRDLLTYIKEIKRSDLLSQILREEEQIDFICNWTKDQVRLWAHTVKTSVHSHMNINEFIIEALAVMERANFLDSHFHLTDAQLLTCLVLLNAENDKGRLLQVGTGEGKTTIISILAIFHALKGKKVDIITSSPVLAERDSKEKAKLYSMFDLQCSDNNDRLNYTAGPKTCYKSEIVYGEVSQFQFDTLRTDYAQLNTLGERQYEIAIVDEVDNMLIDDSSKIARLASSMSGMDQLQIIYHYLWRELVSLQNRIVDIKGTLYLFYGKLSFDENIVVLEYANEQGEIVRIPDLESYITSNLPIDCIGESIQADVDIFIRKHIENCIKTQIEKDIKIPKHLEEFVKMQIPKWVESAVTAFEYQEKVHYIVDENLIKPVDYTSTGIVQSSTNWSDGLHQFLQLKHNLKMTSESLTTNFLSNREYFTKYKTQLFGLTGTLGSEKSKQVLIDIYNVDLFIIPTLHRKQYLSLPDILANNETDWLEKIYQTAVNESSKGRGTLIISETIEQSLIIADKLRQHYRSSAVKLYTMNNMNQEKNIETIKPGEIIIATILAGRGTDIKTNEIERNGGLHVIVTFLPPNKRVEEQVFGRTARQGKRGTGQRILNTANLVYSKDFDIKKITQLRDFNEEQRLEAFIKHELEVITLKDELFVKFCSFLKDMRQKLREKDTILTKGRNLVKSCVTHITPSVYEHNVLLAIEEQWAMFLRKIDNKEFPIDKKQVFKEYNTFIGIINTAYITDCVIKNPYYHIIIANDLISSTVSLKNTYDLAMKNFDRAIELDPENSAAAFAGKGWLLLKVKRRFAFSNRYALGYKEKAIKEFHKALKILNEETAALMSIQTLLQERCHSINTALSKQLMQKNNILCSYKDSLENAVTVIKKSQRLIQIKEIEDCQSSARRFATNHLPIPRQMTGFRDSGILKKIVLYDGIEKGSGKWCDILLAPHSVVHDHEDDIKTCKTIAIFKSEKGFTIKYKQRETNQLIESVVTNQELTDHLQKEPDTTGKLDQDTYSKIYTLVYAAVTSNNGYIRGDFLAPLPEVTDDSMYDVTFNDLTVRQDAGMTIDQAIQTIRKMIAEDEKNSSTVKKIISLPKSKNTVLNKDYKDISISMSEISAEKLKAFFNPNIEIREVTKKTALAQLKDKSSFFHRHSLRESLSPDSFDINLEIVLNNDESETKQGLQVRDAIKIIEKRKDNVLFNLTFIDANEKSKVLKEKVLSSTYTTVDFIGLNGENIKEKMKKIEVKTITLEISDSKERLLKAISFLTTEHVELYSQGKKGRQRNESITQIVNKTAAEKIIQGMVCPGTTIKLIDIDNNIVKKVVDICPNANFNISFNRIEFESLLESLEDELVYFHIHGLTKETAEILIPYIRKESFDFSLIFKNLKNDQTKKLIETAPIEQEHMEIHKLKHISELFITELRPILELSEFSGRGIEYLLEISEKKFMPWRSIVIVFTLAAIQMAVGGALMASGVGATIGLGLLVEGGADLFTVARIGYTRNFSWSDYGKQKAVSLIISAATTGISTIKNAGKGIQNAAVAIQSEVIEQAGTQAISNAADAGQILVTTGLNIKKQGINKIGLLATQNSLLVVNKFVSFSSPFVLEQLKPKISSAIQRRVNDKFCDSILLRLMRKLYALDMLNNQKPLKEKINKIITEIIKSDQCCCLEHWTFIGNSLCKLIIPDVKNASSGFSLGMKVAATVNSINQINTVIENVHDQLIKKLSQIDEETFSMCRILHRHCEVKTVDTKKIVTLLQEQGIIDQIGITDENINLSEEAFLEKLNRINFNEFNQYQKKVIDFLKLLHTNISTIEFNDLSEIMKLVSDMITEHAIKVTESKLTSS